MKFMEENLDAYASRLLETNLYMSLEFEKQEELGDKLLEHAFVIAKGLGCTKVNIGIVEENEILKKWYASYGFVHTGTQKYDFFPFTCGYMERGL